MAAEGSLALLPGGSEDSCPWLAGLGGDVFVWTMSFPLYLIRDAQEWQRSGE